MPAFGWFRILRIIFLALNIFTIVPHILANGEEMSLHFVVLTAFALVWGALASELLVQWNALDGAQGIDLGSAQQILILIIGMHAAICCSHARHCSSV